jgi:4-hydroxy-3-methylbut-2-enyl diphosphate reductase
MPKTILLAEHAGFCHGVKRAVDTTVNLATSDTADDDARPAPVYVLGQLIHNQQAIDALETQGVQTVETLAEVPAGATVVIRTHGATPQLVADAEAAGLTVADATCPDVRLVQQKAIQLAEEGYTVVIIGREDHPEVVGIRAHAQQIPGASLVVAAAVDEMLEKLAPLPRRRIGVVSQTTQLEATFFEAVKQLSQVAKELKVFNTICPATFYRQRAAQDLATRVPMMVVVGGRHSANTTHLAEICRAQGADTLHVETAAELDAPEAQACLARFSTVGVTAGASTPDWIVAEVIDKLRHLT